MVRLSRAIEFSASLRYALPDLSARSRAAGAELRFDYPAAVRRAARVTGVLTPDRDRGAPRHPTIDLAPPPEESAERQVHLDGFTVDLEHADEDVDCLVRLLVDQVIQAAKVIGIHFGSRQPLLLPAHGALGSPPSGGCRHGQQQRQNLQHVLFAGEQEEIGRIGCSGNPSTRPAQEPVR